MGESSSEETMRDGVDINGMILALVPAVVADAVRRGRVAREALVQRHERGTLAVRRPAESGAIAGHLSVAARGCAAASGAQKMRK